MPRVKSNKPKRSPWDTNSTPYGTYTGTPGNPDEWKSSFNFAFYSREKALGILKNFVEDAYTILDIELLRGQPLEDFMVRERIKTAYRKLAMIHHPDKGGDRAMFEKVTAAYTILLG